VFVYVLRRLSLAVPTVWLVATILFLLVRMIPGDTVDVMFDEQSSYAGSMDELREKLGLNDPLMVQYGDYILDLARGDLGRSLFNNVPVRDEIASRAPVTLQLALMTLVVASAIALPVGVIAATKQDTPLDYGLRSISFLLLAVPNFFLGTMVILYGSVLFGWIPPVTYVTVFQDPWSNFVQFLIPALIFGSSLAASQMRMTRTMLLETLRSDYVRTAMSKGLRYRDVVLKHALRNALLPVITIIGLQVAGALGGTVIAEQIFNLPGLGRLTVNAVRLRDYPVLQGVNLLFAVTIVGVNLIVDLSYAYLNPQIRYR